MKKKIFRIFVSSLVMILMAVQVRADRRDQIYRLGTDLLRQAKELAQNSYEHFQGWNDTITDKEQGVLFKSAAFAASCELFLTLSKAESQFFGSRHIRTNLYSAFTYLSQSFRQLDRECRDAGVRPFALSSIKRTLDRMEREFSQWPSPENLAFLHEKYVKARNATVYLIEKRSSGVYIRRPFKDLESLFRYNYDQDRGKNPWDYFVEVSEETLSKMRVGRMIQLSFEGLLVIEQSTRRNRPVFLIENGKRRGITSPGVLQRFGGWDKVYEVPIEVVRKYPQGEPIK